MEKRKNLNTDSENLKFTVRAKNNVSNRNKELLSVYSLKGRAGIQTVFLSCCKPDICSTRKRSNRGRGRSRGSCVTVWIADIDIRRSTVKKRGRERERGGEGR